MGICVFCMGVISFLPILSKDRKDIMFQKTAAKHIWELKKASSDLDVVF